MTNSIIYHFKSVINRVMVGYTRCEMSQKAVSTFTIILVKNRIILNKTKMNKS